MTAQSRKFGLIALLLVALLLGACRAPAPDSHTAPTQDINALYTQVAGTLIAQGQQPSQPDEGQQATQTPVVVTATYTATPEAVESPTPSATSVPPTAATACNQATFITDVTIPDNTQIGRGNTFTKTWRIRNSGTCTWDKDTYDIVYEGGTNLADKNTFDLPKTVAPGETVDISIPMQAPNDNGTYRSNWMIRTGSGAKFGVNGSAASAGVPFFAIIRVGAGSSGGGGNTGGDVRYDFAARYCDAHWSSDSKSNLPCPGANKGSDGFVLVLQDPALEHRKEDEPAIWMRPNHDRGGYISGQFPRYEVRNRDHFVAVIGCLDPSTNCRLTFTLSYLRNNGNEVVLGSWDERFDNLSRTIDIDLSSLAGTEVRFILTVENGNQQYQHANGYWFVPQIVRR